MIHFAKIENSKRLQKTLDVLRDGEWHSTIEIRDEVNTCCPGTCIQELKANGCKVESRCLGQGRYEYRLGERAEEGDSEVSGATEGRFTLAGSSPRVMGKGESSAHNLKIEAKRNKSAADSPAPPYGSGLRPKKWDDWSHVMAEEEQGRMF